MAVGQQEAIAVEPLRVRRVVAEEIVPGWPELAASTASIDNARTALASSRRVVMAQVSKGAVVKRLLSPIRVTKSHPKVSAICR
jgi:hypothetical protein